MTQYFFDVCFFDCCLLIYQKGVVNQRLVREYRLFNSLFKYREENFQMVVTELGFYY